jgi:hypothetical protein
MGTIQTDSTSDIDNASREGAKVAGFQTIRSGRFWGDRRGLRSNSPLLWLGRTTHSWLPSRCTEKPCGAMRVEISLSVPARISSISSMRRGMLPARTDHTRRRHASVARRTSPSRAAPVPIDRKRSGGGSPHGRSERVRHKFLGRRLWPGPVRPSQSRRNRTREAIRECTRSARTARGR